MSAAALISRFSKSCWITTYNVININLHGWEDFVVDNKRHRFLEISWRVLYTLVMPFIKLKFNSHADDIKVEGPCIVVANHVSSWDPLLLGHSFPRMKLYFVASEHLLRLGFLSKLLQCFLEIIPRKKATMGTDTVMSILRHLKAGHAVCLYAEGNSTWDGLSSKVFPATGKLVRNSGATLVTFRLEGGYLSAPRWGKGTRRGKVRGQRVGIYTPEQLKTMKPDEITELINRDIFEDAWERQKIEKVAFRGRNTARYIERVVFLCPKCKKIGGLKGEGKMLRCSCGLETKFTDYGLFDPPVPFENIAQWDKWQQQAVKDDDYVHDEILFRDEDLSLTALQANHEEKLIARGELFATGEYINCAGHIFPFAEIDMMSLVQATILLFSHQGNYYEIRANKHSCHRKYLSVWECVKGLR